jgi:phosphoserine phosphatase
LEMQCAPQTWLQAKRESSTEHEMKRRTTKKMMKRIYFQMSRSGRALLANVLQSNQLRSCSRQIAKQMKALTLEPNTWLRTYPWSYMFMHATRKYATKLKSFWQCQKIQTLLRRRSPGWKNVY